MDADVNRSIILHKAASALGVQMEIGGELGQGESSLVVTFDEVLYLALASVSYLHGFWFGFRGRHRDLDV